LVAQILQTPGELLPGVVPVAEPPVGESHLGQPLVQKAAAQVSADRTRVASSASRRSL
jgi:hypothetical protein